MKNVNAQDLHEYRDRLRDFDARKVPDVSFAPILKHYKFNPRRLLALTFLVLILIGGILLNTPLAQATGLWSWEVVGMPFTWAHFWDAILKNFFMATSASCVTGLTIVDVANYYSTFGHVILLTCVQLGGVSLLTLGTVIVAILLGRVPAGGEAQVLLNYGHDASSRAPSLLWQTIRYVVFFELLGAILFFLRYHFYYHYDLFQSLWYASFHAITAFCNAGISLHPGNFAGFLTDVPYMMIVTSLVTIGGLGFLVIANVFQYRFWRKDLRQRHRITLHARLVLWMTLILSLFGGIVFTLLEWDGVLGASVGPSAWERMLANDWVGVGQQLYHYAGKICAGFSQAMVTRTAGFNFVPMSEISSGANQLSIFLMLIGGSPGSLAGGIKTTTFVILLLTIRAYIRGNSEVQVHRRTINDAICREAMVIIFFYLMTLFLFYFTLRLTETRLLAARGDFALFYEVTSAIGTVGCSLDATHYLSPLGKIIISLAMFLGRLGPITLALIMAGREMTHHTRYPEETITVG